jgi:hypothetical protein
VVHGTPAGVRPSVTFEVPADGWSAMNMVCYSNLDELIVSHGGRPPVPRPCDGRGCDIALHVFGVDEETAHRLRARLAGTANAFGTTSVGDERAVWFDVTPATGTISVPESAGSIWHRVDVVVGQRARVVVVDTIGTSVVVIVAAAVEDYDRMIGEAEAVLATMRFADTDGAERCG